jgi:hypothetical protein
MSAYKKVSFEYLCMSEVFEWLISLCWLTQFILVQLLTMCNFFMLSLFIDIVCRIETVQTW